MDKKTFYVYALLDTRNKKSVRYARFLLHYEPFYIGKGSGNRMLHHVSRATNGESNSKIDNKIRKIVSSRHEVKVVVLRDCLTEHQALSLEKMLISRIGRSPAGPLVNLTEGGEGISGHVHTQATRRKMSKAAKQHFDSLSVEEKEKRRSRLSYLSSGSSNPNAVFSEASVLELRTKAAAGEIGVADVCKAYGVKSSTAWKLLKGYSYKSVKVPGSSKNFVRAPRTNAGRKSQLSDTQKHRVQFSRSCTSSLAKELGVHYDVVRRYRNKVREAGEIGKLT